MLARLRAARGFAVDEALTAKRALLDAYFRAFGRAVAIVGTSGGVDSAVALALCAHARDRRGSAVTEVVAVLAPYFAGAGATNQHEARARGRAIAEQVGATIAEIDLSAPFAAMRAAVERGVGGAAQPWAQGQLASYLRTPAFYFATALYEERGLPAIVIGTTNRDEGSYLGFFGKASDGMVDLQLLGDLHKSEIYALAARLGVPQAIRDAAPTGDTFDGRTDQEMIGASYDEIELIELLRCAPQTERSPDAALAELEARLAARHHANRHKYLGSSPAVFLDVYERAVPGGWQDPRPAAAPIDRARFVNLVPLPAALRAFPATTPRATALPGFGASAWTIEALLSPAEADAFAAFARPVTTTPVGAQGRVDDPAALGPGSQRASIYDEALAAAWWQRLAIALPRIKLCDEQTPTDHDDHEVWRAVGLSPLFRLLRYAPGGRLVPHYDATFDRGDGRQRTLQSVIVFLDDTEGALRLLHEPQRVAPMRERRFDDATEPAEPRDVLAASPSHRGDAIVFDHRLPHDVPPWSGPGDRLVVRTDVIYERCGLPALAKGPRAPLALPPRIAADPFYASAAAVLGVGAPLEEAGWFDDGGAQPSWQGPSAQPSWLLTPLHKLQRRLAAIPLDDPRPLYVLVSTGAFCPVHRGHLEMMARARAQLEADGGYVLGGYLSPSHDRYVANKCGPAAPCAEERIDLLERAVLDDDWLAVDPWESVGLDRAVNFTDVLLRLERYLGAHLRDPRPLRVAYVFGSDNARFALSFVARGHAVCVRRPGFDETLARVRAHPQLRAQPRVHWAIDEATEAATSTQIRAGDESTLPAAVQPAWRRLRSRAKGARPFALAIRDESRWPVTHWLTGREIDAPLAAFRVALSRALTEAFGGAFALTIQRVELAAQQETIRAATRGLRTLSLDPCIPGTHDLALSRRFAIGDSLRPLGFAARPGTPSLHEQLAALPSGAYVLVDDDLVSRQTIDWVERALPPNLFLDDVVVATNLPALGADELADSRDFLLGSRESGLVLLLPDGRAARAPYLLPYVRPGQRVGLPLAAERRFCDAVWAANEVFFAALTPALRVADAHAATATLLDYVGFAPETPLVDVCRWHRDRLRSR